MTNHKNKWMWSLRINCVVFLCVVVDAWHWRWHCVYLRDLVNCDCHTYISCTFPTCTAHTVYYTNACMRYNKYITNMISVLIFHSFAQNDNNTRRLLPLILYSVWSSATVPRSRFIPLNRSQYFSQNQVADDVVRIHNINANLDNGRQWCACCVFSGV